MLRRASDDDVVSFLDDLVVAAPCSMSWEGMSGDDRARVCGACVRTVYNLSDMSKNDAERFLREQGVSECVKFHRRFDGTIITDDCPIGLRKIRNKCKDIYKTVCSFFVMLVSLSTGAGAQQIRIESSDTSTSTTTSNSPSSPADCEASSLVIKPKAKFRMTKFKGYTSAGTNNTKSDRKNNTPSDRKTLLTGDEEPVLIGVLNPL